MKKVKIFSLNNVQATKTEDIECCNGWTTTANCCWRHSTTSLDGNVFFYLNSMVFDQVCGYVLEKIKHVKSYLDM